MPRASQPAGASAHAGRLRSQHPCRAGMRLRCRRRGFRAGRAGCVTYTRGVQGREASFTPGLRAAASADAYRRQARRLRARHRGRPADLHHSLKDLNRARDRAWKADAPRAAPPTIDRPPAPSQIVAVQPMSDDGPRRFAEQIVRRLDGSGVLRYSERLRLLKAASRLGIGRFDANLMIAAVQARHARGQGVPAGHLAVSGRFGRLVQIISFLMVELLITLVAWQVLWD